MKTPDDEAVRLFVLDKPRDDWGELFLLLARVSARYPHASGAALARIAGGALRLEGRNRRWEAARARPDLPAKYQRMVESMRTSPAPCDTEAVRAAFGTLAPTEQAAARAICAGASNAQVATIMEAYPGSASKRADRALLRIRLRLIDAVEFRIRPLRGRRARSW